MSRLILCAQDIRWIDLAWEKDGRLVAQERVMAAPHEFLKAVAQALEKWGRSIAQAEAVAVVTGPGAFTASRVSVTIGNALSFSMGIPVIAVENPGRLSIEQLLGSGAIDRAPSSQSLAHPLYDRPPQITLPGYSPGLPKSKNTPTLIPNA